MPQKSLKEIHDECLNLTKASSPTILQKGKLFKWKGNVTSFLECELQFRCSPYFGLSICDSNTHIPCLPVDPVRNMNKLLKSCNHTVLLKDPEFAVEVFTVESNGESHDYSLVYVLLDAEKLVGEKNMLTVMRSLKSIRNHSSPTGNESALPSEWCYEVLALKISSAILTPKKEVFCLVLVSTMNSECSTNNERFWLILKNREVTWRDLLIPNRVYSILLPANVPRDYFRRRISFYSIFDSSWELSFGQMLHHKDLMKTNTFVYFPRNSKMCTTSENAVITPYVEKWLSITDPSLKSLKFASVFGIIKEIKYIDAWKSLNCSWCDKNDNIFEKTIQEHDNSEANAEEENNFEMEWCSPTSFSDAECIDDDKIYFPEVKATEDKITGFGIGGGKLTIQITLRKNYSADLSYVFLKRWKHAQYPAGLVPGVTVCFTDVNVKRSKKKNYYFVSTPLTRVLYLEVSGLRTDIVPQIWGPFRFPFKKQGYEKIWGILELDLLSKVSILAKCKLCNERFVQYCCSNIFCFNNRRQGSPEYTVIAVARLFVRGFVGTESSALFLKNENVQKYLGLPNRIWQKLCVLSANSELLYLHQDSELDLDTDVTNMYFQMYCKIFRPKMRFHVCCRPFKNDENKFFGVELSEISTARLSASRAVLEGKAE